MDNKIHRVIYYTSLGIIGIFLFTIIIGLPLFGKYAGRQFLESGASLIWFVTPLAVIGTLFGTLKETQSPGRKMLIICGTIGGAVFLTLVVILGLFAATLD